MPRHLFHDICPRIVWHTKNDERLESADRDEVCGWKDEERPGAGENG